MLMHSLKYDNNVAWQQPKICLQCIIQVKKQGTSSFVPTDLICVKYANKKN